MKPTQIFLDLFPFTILKNPSLSTFYVLCPCCESRVDAFPIGNDSKAASIHNMAVCELCEMSFDYSDKDIRQTPDECLDLPQPTTHSDQSPPVDLSSFTVLQKANPMDPNQTFAEMFQAMCVQDLETARELALALKQWLAKGGFYPKDRTSEATDLYLESVLTRTAGRIAPDFPFSLVCWYCDDGTGIKSEEEAMELGWIAIEPALQLLQANYLGVCPDCRPRYESDLRG